MENEHKENWDPEHKFGDQVNEHTILSAVITIICMQ